MKNVSPIRAHRAANQSGFNLIEAAIVLGIVGLIVGGIWAAAGSAYENMRQQNAAKQLLSLVQGVRGFYSQNPSDVVGDTATLIGLGVVPSDMVFTDSSGTRQLRHPWNDRVTIADASTLGIPAFSVTYTNLSRAVCQNFITRSANVARGSGLLRVETGSSVYLDLIADPAAVAVSVPNCAETGSPVFSFGLRG